MTPGAIEPLHRSAGTLPEVERQLAAAAQRHREVLTSMRELGRPEAGQHIAVKAVGRAVHLVSFALRHAAESGVALERLVELTGWERQLVNDTLAQAPEPSYVARLVPAGLDPGAVARAAASIEATARLQALTRSILAEVDHDHDHDAWSPAPADVAELHERLDGQWRLWRDELGRRDTRS